MEEPMCITCSGPDDGKCPSCRLLREADENQDEEAEECLVCGFQDGKIYGSHYCLNCLKRSAFPTFGVRYIHEHHYEHSVMEDWFRAKFDVHKEGFYAMLSRELDRLTDEDKFRNRDDRTFWAFLERWIFADGGEEGVEEYASWLYRSLN